MAPVSNLKHFLHCWGSNPPPPLTFVFASLWHNMLIRTETACQLLRKHGQKGDRGEANWQGERGGKPMERKGKVKTWAL